MGWSLLLFRSGMYYVIRKRSRYVVGPLQPYLSGLGTLDHVWDAMRLRWGEGRLRRDRPTPLWVVCRFRCWTSHHSGCCRATATYTGPPLTLTPKRPLESLSCDICLQRMG